MTSVSLEGKSTAVDAGRHFNQLLTSSGFLSRCPCLVFWTEANYDPSIPGQWGTLPCLRVQPETYDETNRFLLTLSGTWRTKGCLRIVERNDQKPVDHIVV